MYTDICVYIYIYYMCSYIHHKRKNLLNCNLTETICFSGLHLAGQTLRWSRCSHFTTGVSRSHGLWCLKGPRMAGTFAMPIFDPLKSRCIAVFVGDSPLPPGWTASFWMKFPFAKQHSVTSMIQIFRVEPGADLRSTLDFMVRVNLDARGARRPKELGQLPEAWRCRTAWNWTILGLIRPWIGV